jgi:hypothetical protein
VLLGSVYSCPSLFFQTTANFNRSLKSVGLTGKPAAGHIDTQLPHTFRNPVELLLVRSTVTVRRLLTRLEPGQEAQLVTTQDSLSFPTPFSLVQLVDDDSIKVGE